MPVPTTATNTVTTNGCAGDRFAGAVTLIGNFGATFNNNIVSGNLTVDNGGPAATRPLIRNTVYGARSCQCEGTF